MGETVVDPTALPNAIVGDAYETFNMRIPTDTVIEYDLGSGPQLFDPVYINTIGVNEIQGLPMGFSYECASQNPDGTITDMNCIFPGEASAV